MTVEQRERIFIGSMEMLEKLRIQINYFFNQKNFSQESNEFSQFYLFILLINCDANTLIKHYCRVDQRWEEISLIKQIYILINESTKKIIGFESQKKNIKTEKLSNKAYWNNKLRNYVNNCHSNLISEFEEISIILINYRNNEFQKDIQILRNYSVHYDNDLNTENFLNIWNKTNVDESFQLFGKWLAIISLLLQFTQKIIIQKK